MNVTLSSSRLYWKRIAVYAFLFLFFFQFISDFVENIYTFGLLGTTIPPQIVSVVLFFSPLLVLPFGRGLRPALAPALVLLAAAARLVEVYTQGGTRMLASGVGLGLVLVLLPVLFSYLTHQNEETAALEYSSGLMLALVSSILLRSMGSGSDFSLIHPWLNWVLAALLLFPAFSLIRDTPVTRFEWRSVPFGRTLALCIGVCGCLAVLYFAFASPVVMARWSEVSLRLVLVALAVSLGLFFAALSSGLLSWVTRPVLLAWNVLFVLSGTVAIALYQVYFPAQPSAYPLDQPALTAWRHIPLVLMLLLAPVVLFDFILLLREIARRKPTPRSLAGGFTIGAFLILLVVLMQAFTTVYDYIPVVGPLFRDKFWLVFLLANLMMALPAVSGRAAAPRLSSSLLRIIILPLSLSALLVSALLAVIAVPAPSTPPSKDTLRVVTYNIQQGYSAEGKRSYEDQLAVVKQLDPDIVGLQESDTARFSGGNADVVRTFARGLNMYSYYGPRTVTGTFGIALLSRYPIQNPRTFFMYSKGEQTAAIQAEISANGRTYHILVTHLGNGGPIIQQQQVLERLQGQQNVIAMGDFNFKPSTDQYKLTLESLRDAWAQAGSPTQPGLDASDLIDHIFVSPDLPVKDARYILSPASDHPALYLDLQP